MKPLNLPAAYQPFSKLRIGDNVFEDVQALVTVGGRAPLLIGTGDVPHIWLSIPGSQPEADWFDVIVDNISPPAIVLVDARKRLFKVTKDNTVLLSAISSLQGLNVNILDLRPLGLDIFKDDQGLHIMGNILGKNVFHGVPVILACPGLG